MRTASIPSQRILVSVCMQSKAGKGAALARIHGVLGCFKGVEPQLGYGIAVTALVRVCLEDGFGAPARIIGVDGYCPGRLLLFRR